MSEELRKHIERFWKRVNKTESCWVWTGTKIGMGYGSLMVKTKWWKAHRFSWFLSNGEIPEGLCVLHKCDNPPCVNPSHLFLGTRIENNRDRDIKKRTVIVQGSKNGHAKLDETKIHHIKNLIKRGLSFASIGRQYKVRWQTIQAIAKGRTWKAS